MKSCLNYARRSRVEPTNRADPAPRPLHAAPAPLSAGPLLFAHSNLHVLFTTDDASPPFAQIIIFGLVHQLQRGNSPFPFNHVRLTNLAHPNWELHERPLMEQPTATLLILNSCADDLAHHKCQLTLKRYFLHPDTQSSSLLVLLNVPVIYRVLPACFHRAKRRLFEADEKRLLLSLVPALGGRQVHVTACCQSNAQGVARNILQWIRVHNKPFNEELKLVAPLRSKVDLPSASALISRVSLLRTNYSPRTLTKFGRQKEYEDLPNWRLLNSLRPVRASKSLSWTQLRLALKNSPTQFRPEEPRYDAEYEQFRSRRETRRFVRRLREAMREFRRLSDQPSSSSSGGATTTTDHMSSSMQGASTLFAGSLSGVSMLHSGVSGQDSLLPLVPPSSDDRLEDNGQQAIRPPLPVDSMETMLANASVRPALRPAPSSHRLPVAGNAEGAGSRGFVVGGPGSVANHHLNLPPGDQA